MKKRVFSVCVFLLLTCVFLVFATGCGEQPPKEDPNDEKEIYTLSTAYDVAVKNGFDGTLTEFMNAIRGLAIEFRTTDTAIQWHYEDVDTWYDLVALAKLVGEKGDPGEKGETGRGILKTEIIDGVLWITYTDDPENPVRIGELFDKATEGLDFYPLPDGTYGVTGGTSKYLESIVIPSSYHGVAVTQILPEAFANASNLKQVTIPESIKRIETNAFSGCSSLTKITIPEGVTRIETNTFSGCSALTKITIPGSIQSIGSEAFSGCISLASIEIPISVTTIGSYAFFDCFALTEIKIPENVKSIGYGAFYGCLNLGSVTLPFVGGQKDETENVHFGYIFGTERNQYGTSFYAIPASLKNVVITSGTTIRAWAFRDCTGLTNITIPESVTGIEAFAFHDCSNLDSITLPFIGERKDGTGNTHFGYIFGTERNQYGESFYAIPASLKAVAITSGTSIGSSAFSGCTGLTSIEIPNSVTKIGYEAFRGCTNLVYNDYQGGKHLGNSENPYLVLIQGTATSGIHKDTKIIYSSAFKDCTSLTSIEIPNSVTSIGDYAFYDCTGLTSIEIPSSVTAIGSYAFYGCAELTNIYYVGTESEWNAITLHYLWNRGIDRYTIYFNANGGD